MARGRFSEALAAAVIAFLCVSAAFPQDLMPMDTSEVDPAMLDDFHGPWEIRDESGEKRCRVLLTDGEAIGGSAIDVDPGCAAVFPIMGEIAAWRLMEGWAIDLVDATRNRRIRFYTPDERYIADPETDGIATIEQLPRQ